MVWPKQVVWYRIGVQSEPSSGSRPIFRGSCNWASYFTKPIPVGNSDVFLCPTLVTNWIQLLTSVWPSSTFTIFTIITALNDWTFWQRLCATVSLIFYLVFLSRYIVAIARNADREGPPPNEFALRTVQLKWELESFTILIACAAAGEPAEDIHLVKEQKN